MCILDIFMPDWRFPAESQGHLFLHFLLASHSFRTLRAEINLVFDGSRSNKYSHKNILIVRAIKQSRVPKVIKYSIVHKNRLNVREYLVHLYIYILRPT